MKENVARKGDVEGEEDGKLGQSRKAVKEKEKSLPKENKQKREKMRMYRNQKQ